MIRTNPMAVRDFALADHVADAVDQAPGADHVVPWRRRAVVVEGRHSGHHGRLLSFEGAARIDRDSSAKQSNSSAGRKSVRARVKRRLRSGVLPIVARITGVVPDVLGRGTVG
jgi:hypothetical protein